MMSTNDALRDGIAALRAGQRLAAEQLLRQAVQHDPTSEQAWLWLSGAVTTIDERRRCLERVLAINPNNTAAQQGLAALGPAAPAQPALAPRPAAAQPAPTPDPLAALRPQPVLAVPAAVTATPAAASPAPPRRRWRRRAAIGLATIILILLVGGGSARYLLGPDPDRWIAILTNPAVRCSFQSRTYVEEVTKVFDEWDDANKLAGQTGRMALSGPVAEMQEIRRRTSDIESPACAGPVKEAGVAYMDAVIDGYMKFMAQDPDSAVSASFETARTKQDEFTKGFAALSLDWKLR